MNKPHRSRESKLEMTLLNARVRILVNAGENKRYRRMLLLMILRSFDRLQTEIANCEIRHLDGDGLTWMRQHPRPISFFQTPEITTPEQRLGFQIRTRRLSFGLTQAELAAKCGCGSTYISELERGHHRPRRLILDKINKALGLVRTDPGVLHDIYLESLEWKLHGPKSEKK